MPAWRPTAASRTKHKPAKPGHPAIALPSFVQRRYVPSPLLLLRVVGRPATQLRLLRCPFSGIPLLADPVGPRANLDANPVGIEGKEGVIALHVVLFFRRKVNPSTHAHTALVCVVYLAAVLNGEGEVLDSDIVVAVLATICLSEPEAGLGLGALDMVLPESLGRRRPPSPDKSWPGLRP